MTALRDDALRVLEEWRAPAAGQEALRTAYVEHLRGHPDGILRSCLPDHVTASTLVVGPRLDVVLLTLHRKADRWFQLGGHLEEVDTTLVDGAAREAREESGLPGLRLDPVPVHLDAHEVPFCGGGARHLDVRFVALAPEEATPRVSAESTELAWWPCDALPSDEPSLRVLVDLGLDRLRRRGAVG